MNIFPFIFAIVLSLISSIAAGQNGYWQQAVRYKIDVHVNTQVNQLSGTQKIVYRNNSPDTLSKIFFHLYWNAFQPGSMMDLANRDRFSGKWIKDYSVIETGFIKINWIKVAGRHLKTREYETILEVLLNDPLLPHSGVTIELKYEAQIPQIISRAGRDSKSGVRYTIAQWYPKICEYDADGWHANPFIGDGEFYGVWGDYDVRIQIDKDFIVGATGNLLNAQQVGYGYEQPGKKVRRPEGDKLIWHFSATKVHDFVWAADPDYKHIIRKIPHGPVIHVLYNQDSTLYSGPTNRFPTIRDFWRLYDSLWNEAADAVVAVYPFIRKKFGDYPYQQFSIIQGGTGPMEYPMAAIVTDMSFKNIFHEWMHSWYHGVLASNEQRYPWMDEGFTQWAGEHVYNHLITGILKSRIPKNSQLVGHSIGDTFNLEAEPLHNIHKSQYAIYYQMVRDNKQEPLTTWSDHYWMKSLYANNAYSKGTVYLEQLAYIVGNKVLDKILLEYYNRWKFKHPKASDFLRVAERISGIQLGWYNMYWINTTQTIDYGIDTVWEEKGKTLISLKKAGSIPMPVDLEVQAQNGKSELIYIPMSLMIGEKASEDNAKKRTILPPWKYTSGKYIVELNTPLRYIEKIEIDRSARMADINRSDNLWPRN